MNDNVEDLNYDCNYNLFLAKTLLQNLKTQRERQMTLRWLRKLTGSNRSIAEMKLRNDFMYHLVLNLYNNKLQPPFDSNPPQGPLPAIAQLLPGSIGPQYAGQRETGEVPRAVESATNNFSGLSDKQRFDHPMIDQSSPDGGLFLSNQPIPKCGAFCYLAVVNRPKKHNLLPNFNN